MLSTPFKKVLLVVITAAVGLAWLLHLANAWFKSPPPAAPPTVSKADLEPKYPPTSPPLVPVETETATGDKAKEIAPPNITREQAEAWLAKHNRNAASLLAVFRALADTNYLNEAASNFPNDPHVELTVLAHDAFPEDRRKWLDLFKASSPSNSLANYLSAADYFKSSQPDAAVQELTAATGKSQFDLDALETRLDAVQMYLAMGKSPLESATSALADNAGDLLPQLGTLKQIAVAMGDLEKQHLAAGDPDSAANLAQMGIMLGNQINSGDSGKDTISHLVGIAIESYSLRGLDQNTAYDFLGGLTPTQFGQQLKDEKVALAELHRNFGAVHPQMSDDEEAAYLQRSMVYGEAEAMKWVVQQHPPATAPK